MSNDNVVLASQNVSNEQKSVLSENSKIKRKVLFPEDDGDLVTEYFEPANPWRTKSSVSRETLLAEYLESCREHRTEPIEVIVTQIKELSDTSLSNHGRAPRIYLTDCIIRGSKPIDALEALLRRIQFRRFELHNAVLDDEGAEAIFDMIEYYESANILNVTGGREFGIRGWQACSRMIKMSAELLELEIRDVAVGIDDAPVLARALRPHTCVLRSMCLTRANLAGPALTCLVKVLKTNNSVRELKLGDNELNYEDARQLASLLQMNTRIQLLDLSNNYIQDKGVQYLSQAIVAQSCPTPPSGATSPLSPVHSPFGESRGLAFLVLWNNQLTWNCAQYISDALKSSSSLCVLNIGRNILGAEAMRSISIGAAGASLQSLGLQAARLGVEAAGSIAHMLRHCLHLQRLDLRDNKLGEAGLEIILTALKQNTTLTQIDLDDVVEPTTLTIDTKPDTSEKVRLTREIRALCRRNEPSATEHRPHRKISLTCHSVFNMRSPPEDSRRGRLRSPAPSPTPSPAGSPIPPNHSRFSVTRVTPDRESSSESSPSPSTPTRYSPSRFKVVQVADPPQITVQSAKPDKPKPSRFSVSRNYDDVYSIKPTVVNDSVIVKNTSDTKSNGSTDVSDTQCDVTKVKKTNNSINNSVVDKTIGDTDSVNKNVSDVSEPSTCDTQSDVKNEGHNVNRNAASAGTDSEATDDDEAKYQDKTEEVSFNESVKSDGDNNIHVSETKLVKNTTECSNKEKSDVKVEITVKKETLDDRKGKKTFDSESCFKNLDDLTIRKAVDNTIKKIEAVITTDLGNIIQEMGDLSTKTHLLLSKKADTVEKINLKIDEPNLTVLKKNKSESSLDSPDLEVRNLMKDSTNAFCDSNSSFSCSSIESLSNNDPHTLQKEFDRNNLVKMDLISSTDSVDSSQLTPVNITSVSSNESASPVFCKEVHDSLSSLEASVSSIESARGDKIMFTSADSGFDFSSQNQDLSSNDTLTLKSLDVQETLTNSPVHSNSSEPKNRVRKLSTASPVLKENETVKESKLPSHLEKLLSIFQHPSALFTRTNTDDEKRSSTPPKKESVHLTSSFWSWGQPTSEKCDEKPSEKVDEKMNENDDKSSESSPENSSDTTLSERVQVSYIDEVFSKKLDSKSPSTDTETFTTDKVQNVDLSFSDNRDLIQCDNVKSRPRSFASVLKTSSNLQEKPPSPQEQSVDKLPNRVIRGIKENISPENTLNLNLFEKEITDSEKNRETVDVAKEALTLLADAQDFEPNDNMPKVENTEQNLADELLDAELKLIDLSPELVVEDDLNPTDVFSDIHPSTLVPERAKIKSNSLEDLSRRLQSIEVDEEPRKSKIMFKIPTTSSKPTDIPQGKFRLRTRSGSSPKSLPDNLIKSPISKECCRKKKKVSSLGKMARDSLLALNLSEEELVEFRRSYKLSVESLKSLESVSEDANSQSHCKICCGTSQESLISLDSISEDCRCDRDTTDSAR